MFFAKLRKILFHAADSVKCVSYAAALATVFAVPASCVRALPGETPPANATLYYPEHITVSAAGDTAFIVNTNFDQRFNAAWVTEVDVPQLVHLAQSGGDVASALRQGAKIPSLGGAMVLNDIARRAFISHRGQGLVTALDLKERVQGGQTLSCGEASDQPLLGRLAHTSCDSAHLFDLRAAIVAAFGLVDDPSVQQYDDPFALGLLAQPLGGQNSTLLVGMLRGARLAVVGDIASQGLSLAGMVPTTTHGIAALATAVDGTWVASSRSAEHALALGGVPEHSQLLAQPRLDANNLIKASNQSTATPVSYQLSSDLGSFVGEQPAPQASALLFAPNDPTHLFAVSRSPDAVVSLRLTTPPRTTVAEDGSLFTEAGPSVFMPTAAEVVAQGSLNALAYVSRPQGDLLIASSLTQDMLYFFDPADDDLQLVHRLPLAQGLGPAGLAVVEVDGKQMLLVTTFFDHGLSLVDVSSPSFADFHVTTTVHDDHFLAAPRHR